VTGALAEVGLVALYLLGLPLVAALWPERWTR
jgi:hypothetical protein